MSLRVILNKIFIGIIVVMMMIISCSGCSGQKSSPVEDFTFELIDGEVTITGYTGSDLDIIIPDVIEKRPVTTIGEEAFMKYDMNSVILPKTLKTIEYDAFRACKKLKEITIPDGVIAVKGEYTFDECESLETIHLPDTIQQFDEYLIDTPWYENQKDGVLYIDNVCIGFKGKDYPKSLAINNGTKSIIHLFHSFESQVPGSVRNNAMNFYDIYIPKSVIYIAPKAVGYYTKETYYYGVKSGQYPKPGFNIHGTSGSYAEVYANENEINFINIDSKEKDIDGTYSFVEIVDAATAEAYKETGMYPKGDMILTIKGKDAVMQILAENYSYSMIVNTETQTMTREDNNKTFKFRFEGDDFILCEDDFLGYAEYRFKKK